MTTAYKEAELTHLISGERRGFAMTKSFGMGMDVSDIKLIIQWRATCKLATLWQRFGRAVQNKELTRTVILFAEKDFFDDECEAKNTRKRQRESTRKRKASKKLTQPPATKRLRLTVPSESSTSNGGNAGPEGGDSDSEESDEEYLGNYSAPRTLDNNGRPSHLPQDSNTRLADLKDTLVEAARARNLKQMGHPEKQCKRELDPVMDYLINTEKRAGLMCRRKVFDVCFENDTADTDHLECNKQLPMGCDCCCISSPPICCDIHNPAEFTEFTSDFSKPPAPPACSRLPKYDRMQHDYALLDAIDQWQEQTIASVYGWHHLNDMGPSILMCNAIIEHIVDCAHHCKIASVQELKRETGWSDADQFGGEVITLVQRHTAPLATPFVSTPLRPITSSTINATQALQVPSLLHTTQAGPSNVGAPVPKRKIKCGACGEEGHNGMF
ncbi:hypothetical protein PAXRUDRAFT_17914 [Paxillus rubicundulus Ve08.2h10]|uniref:Uncharacterized protein n=1 Tax=Paxillus rubicundulus Ve08.2h10 TaxID=930991 RepID=A0A0D0CZW5_9AGAM|nr:hypothetical protein PAXRUDRAFT_17914 [Paxillus rubicundulus Ve08.2h10]